MANSTRTPVFDFDSPLNGSCIGDNCTMDDTDNVSLDAAHTMRYVYCAVGSLGMIGNAIVIGVILGSSRMRKATTNVFIANQSAIDFSASMFIILCTLFRDVSKVKGLLAKDIFCRLWSDNFPIWGLFVSSTYNLICITMERYSGICYPMKHHRTCTRGKARFALIFTWVIGLAYNMAYMVPTSPYKDGLCTSYSEWPSLNVQRAVGFLTIAVQFFIPLVIITFAYIRIVLVLRQGVNAHVQSGSGNDNVDKQDERREKRMKRARMNVVKTLVMVAMSFVLCWSPNQIIYTMFNCGVQMDFNGTFYHFTVIAVFLNCCINPFIYAFQYDQFKNELFKKCRRSTPDVSEASVTSQTTAGKGEKTGQTTKMKDKIDDKSEKRKNDEFDNPCYEENE